MRKALLLACIVSLSLFFVSNAVSKDEYVIKPTYTVGEKAEIKKVSDMSGDVTSGGETMSMAMKMEKAYSEEILAVDANGNATKVKYIFTTFKNTTTVMGETFTDSLALEGKTVTVTLNKDGTIKVEGATLDEDGSVGELQAMIAKDPFFNELPNTPVAVGYQYTVAKDGLVAMLNGSFAGSEFTEVSEGKFQCTFQSVEQYSGKNCAKIGITMDVKAKDPNASYDITGTGTQWVALEGLSNYGGELKFKFKMKGTDTDDSGDMTVAIKTEIKIIK